MLEGEGGAGSFSDGKITLSPTRGTHGARLFAREQERLLSIVDNTVRRFVPDGVDYPPTPTLTALDGHDGTGLRFESYPLLHVGSDGVRQFGQRYCAHLQAEGVTVRTGVQAVNLTVDDGRARGATLLNRRAGTQWDIEAGAVIVATGMMGTPWLERQLRDIGVRLVTGPADIGVRVETTAAALEPFIRQFYDFKVTHTSADGIPVRSFCVNGNGYVVNEYHRSLGIRAVNGHSFLDHGSGQSNLAILATIDQTFTDDPNAYVRDLATAINAGAGGYPVSQPLSGFLPDFAHAPAQGVRPSNPKTRPGRLNEALPPMLHEAFGGYLRALGQVLPPILGADTVIYAPEIKYYNYRVPINFGTWESDIAGLFVVGNAAGYTASLSAAALSGIIAGRAAASQIIPAR